MGAEMANICKHNERAKYCYICKDERIEELERELADVRELNEKYVRTNNARSDEIDRLESVVNAGMVT